MTEKLPISIDVNESLLQKFTKISSVSRKLEAQFNFQTMVANWYGDEYNLWFVRLCIETPSSFEAQKKYRSNHTVQNYSDDVFSYFDKAENEQILMCYIAITESELTMLTQQSKLLAGFLNVKLQKTLNLIAKQLSLGVIPT
jgi:hypothetical protein